MKIRQRMLRKAGGIKRPMAKLKSQLPMAAMPMPEARVSSDHTSAAYTQQMGASVRA